MPRVIMSQTRYMKSDFVKWLNKEMYLNHITQEQMGTVLGITRQGFQKKLSSCNFSFEELVEIFQFFKTSQETVSELLIYRRRD